jgi:CDP-diacylglycerol--glycerol-3-phosphate 3-phosphatidyltransferase
VLTGVFTVLLTFPNEVTGTLAFVCFVAAAFTDFLDGRIARSRGLVTSLGKLLDPLADKILVTAGFVMLMRTFGPLVPAWAVVAILAREFAVTGARAQAASQGAVIAAVWSGKVKAVAQMVYVGCVLGMIPVVLMLRPAGFTVSLLESDLMRVTVYGGAVVVALITLYSGYDFFRANWKVLGLGEER